MSPVWNLVTGVHAGALAELAELVTYGLEALDMGTSEPLVVLGAHTAPEAVPAGAIVYNTEHPSSPWMGKLYLDLLKRHETWSYYEGGPGTFVPIGYMPQMTRIPKPLVQDVDVLFYGSLNERRSRILMRLIATGLKVVALPVGTYGAKRDEWIAKSKVVLSVHYYLPAVLEIVRLSYLWQNRKCVVAEGAGMRTREWVENGGFAYEDLVEACVEFANDADMRSIAEDSCFKMATTVSETSILREVLRPKIERAGYRSFPHVPRMM